MEILQAKPGSLDCFREFPWKFFDLSLVAWIVSEDFHGRRNSLKILLHGISLEGNSPDIFWIGTFDHLTPKSQRFLPKSTHPLCFWTKTFDHLHKIWILCNNKMFLKLVARSYLLCLMDPFRHSLSCQQKVPSQINFSQFFYPSHLIFLTIFFALKRQVCWQKGGFPNLRCETKKIANLRPLCFPPNPLSRK